MKRPLIYDYPELSFLKCFLIAALTIAGFCLAFFGFLAWLK